MDNNNNPINLQKNEPEKDNREEGVLDEYVSGYQQLELEGYNNNIRKARNAIFAAGSIMFIWDMIFYFQYKDYLDNASTLLFIAITCFMIFIGLGLYTKKSPVAAIAIALVLFVGIWLYALSQAGFDQIYRGIVVRIIIIYFLVTGLQAAREAERLKKEM